MCLVPLFYLGLPFMVLWTLPSSLTVSFPGRLVTHFAPLMLSISYNGVEETCLDPKGPIGNGG